MPYTLKTQQIAVKDPDTGVYSGVDILAEQTTEGLLTEITATGEAVKADVSAQMATERSDFNTYVSGKEAELDQYKSTTETNINTYVTNKNQEIATMIADADKDVSDLEDRKQDVADAVAGMLSKGVDNTLTTANIPAESKATGDLFETIVEGKSTQPNDKWNRLWIKPSASDYEIPTMDEFDDLKSALDQVGVIDYNTTYNTLDATYKRVIAAYPIKDVNAEYFYSVDNVVTTSTVVVYITDAAIPYSANDKQTVASISAGEKSIKGTFTINENVKSVAKYIMVFSTTANAAASFDVTLGINNKIVSDMKNNADNISSLSLISQTDQMYILAAINGGEYKPYLVQGTISKIIGTDYLENTANSERVANDVKHPMLLFPGDVVTVDSPYAFNYINRVSIDETGTLQVEGISNPASPWTAAVAGLYLMMFKKSAGGKLKPSNIDGSVTITCNGFNSGYKLNKGLDTATEIELNDYRSLLSSLYKGQYAPKLIQGTISKVTGTNYLQNSSNSERVSSDVTHPIMLYEGDTITVDSPYAIQIISKITLDEIGPLQIQSINPTSPYTVESTGLYLLVVKKSAGGNLTPADVSGSVHISRNTFNEGSSDGIGYQRKKDPYTNLDWTSEQIVTTCHAHCEEEEYLQNMISAGCDALIPTNYKPSKPYYPLTRYFPSVENIGNYLSAPNSEVSGFHFGSSDRYSHICPIGAFIAVGNAESSTYLGGNFDEFVMYARRARKGFGQGGIIINHPNWSGDTAAEIIKALQYPDVLGIEIYNYGCEASEGNGYALDILDAILSTGVQCYGFAAPDHAYENTISDFNKPFGFINVLVPCHTEEGLLSAISNGAFYSTLYNDGLKITEIKLLSGTYSIKVESEETASVKFITKTRNSTVSGNTATFDVTSSDVFVRAEVTVRNNTAYTNAIML